MSEDYPAPPPELSPAAQAVLDAFRSNHTGQGCLAAALRAAADQVVPSISAPDIAALQQFERWDTKRFVRLQLLAIAAELDGATTTSENV